MTHQRATEIRETLEQFGVSRFNSYVLPDGCVVFRSPGLQPDDVAAAREYLVRTLRVPEREFFPIIAGDYICDSAAGAGRIVAVNGDFLDLETQWLGVPVTCVVHRAELARAVVCRGGVYFSVVS